MHLGEAVRRRAVQLVAIALPRDDDLMSREDFVAEHTDALIIERLPRAKMIFPPQNGESGQRIGLETGHEAANVRLARTAHNWDAARSLLR